MFGVVQIQIHYGYWRVACARHRSRFRMWMPSVIKGIAPNVCYLRFALWEVLRPGEKVVYCYCDQYLE